MNVCSFVLCFLSFCVTYIPTLYYRTNADRILLAVITQKVEIAVVGRQSHPPQHPRSMKHLARLDYWTHYRCASNNRCFSMKYLSAAKAESLRPCNLWPSFGSLTIRDSLASTQALNLDLNIRQVSWYQFSGSLCDPLPYALVARSTKVLRLVSSFGVLR